MGNGNWIWLVAAAIFLGAAIINLVSGQWQTSLYLFLLAVVFCYAGLRKS